MLKFCLLLPPVAVRKSLKKLTSLIKLFQILRLKISK